MTKRHFEDLAAIVRDAETVGFSPVERFWLAAKLANVARSDNPRFDTFRFYRACGVYEVWQAQNTRLAEAVDRHADEIRAII
jgi:hypothetical protein